MGFDPETCFQTEMCKGLVAFAERECLAILFSTNQSQPVSETTLRVVHESHNDISAFDGKDRMIVIVNDRTNVKGLVQSNNVRFDSRLFFLSTSFIYEIYKLDDIVVFKYGLDALNNIPFLWDRRSDLMGSKLKTAYVFSSSYGEFDTEKCIKGPYCERSIKSGTHREIQRYMESLITNLNFTIDWKISKTYGNLDPKTGWSGVIKILNEGEAEFSAFPLSMTMERNQAIEYSFPIRLFKLRLWMQAPKQTTSFLTYLNVFSPEYFLATFAALILLIISLVTFQDGSSVVTRILTSAVTASASMLSLDVGSNVSPRPSHRIIVLTIFLYGYLTWSVYNAALISSLTSYEPTWPVERFDQVIERGYQILTKKGSVTNEILRNGKDTRRIYDETIEGNDNAHYKSADDLMEKILSGKKYLGFVSETFGNLHVGKRRLHCDISSPNTVKIILQEGLGFKPGSQYRDIFNHHILKMRIRGTLNKIHQEAHKKLPTNDCKQSGYSTLSYENVAAMFILLVVFVGLSLIVALMELLLSRYNKKK